MSGIGGIIHFDDRAVTADSLGRFVDVCAHRGPHGRGIWTDGPVGLAQRLLDPGEKEPPRPRQLDLHDRGLVVVADARLDNRRELAAALGFVGTDVSEVAVADLIRAAYLEWGDRSPERLLGDFAFAIWDVGAKRLFCARDHFGVRPFCYSLTERALVFASELKSILALGEIPARVNETRIAEYLASIVLDNESTFYEGILRLPPGHTLSVEGRAATIARYWTLERVTTARSGSPDEHVERFREIFYEAVRCRLPATGPVGVLLSGGLDSSSIAAAMMDLLPTADPPRMHAFSAVFETVTECDESPWVRAVLDNRQAVRHSIHGDRIGPFSDIDRLGRHHDEPYEAPNLFMVWALCAQTRDAGIGTLLDGYDGDTTLSHGLGYLHEMAIAGRWLSLATQLRGLAKIDGGSPWAALWRFYRFHAVRPMLARSPWNLPARSYRRALGVLGRRSGETAATNSKLEAITWISPELARRVDLDERYRRWAKASPESARSGAEEHYRAITGCIQPFALEVYDRTAAAFSIEYAHPFWDKRLIEFALALPPELKLDRGWSRMVLRRAMRDTLPEKVVWRNSNADFTPNVRNALMSLQNDDVDKLFADQELEIVAGYVDVDRVRKAYRRLRNSDNANWRQDLFTVWKVLSLGLWLRR